MTSHIHTHIYINTREELQKQQKGDHNDKHYNLKLRLFTKSNATAQISIVRNPAKEDSPDKCTKYPA